MGKKGKKAPSSLPKSPGVLSEIEKESRGLSLFELKRKLQVAQRAIQKKDQKKMFSSPITDAVAPGYSQIISTPMDFYTINKKIAGELYTTFRDYMSDVALVLQNCMTYNLGETYYYKQAAKLVPQFEKVFEKEFGISYKIDAPPPRSEPILLRDIIPGYTEDSGSEAENEEPQASDINDNPSSNLNMGEPSPAQSYEETATLHNNENFLSDSVRSALSLEDKVDTPTPSEDPASSNCPSVDVSLPLEVDTNQNATRSIDSDISKATNSSYQSVASSSTPKRKPAQKRKKPKDMYEFVDEEEPVNAISDIPGKSKLSIEEILNMSAGGANQDEALDQEPSTVSDKPCSPIQFSDGEDFENSGYLQPMVNDPDAERSCTPPEPPVEKQSQRSQRVPKPREYVLPPDIQIKQEYIPEEEENAIINHAASISPVHPPQDAAPCQPTEISPTSKSKKSCKKRGRPPSTAKSKSEAPPRPPPKLAPAPEFSFPDSMETEPIIQNTVQNEPFSIRAPAPQVVVIQPPNILPYSTPSCQEEKSNPQVTNSNNIEPQPELVQPLHTSILEEQSSQDSLLEHPMITGETLAEGTTSFSMDASTLPNLPDESFQGSMHIETDNQAGFNQQNECAASISGLSDFSDLFSPTKNVSLDTSVSFSPSMLNLTPTTSNAPLSMGPSPNKILEEIFGTDLQSQVANFAAADQNQGFVSFKDPQQELIPNGLNYFPQHLPEMETQPSTTVVDGHVEGNLQSDVQSLKRPFSEVDQDNELQPQSAKDCRLDEIDPPPSTATAEPSPPPLTEEEIEIGNFMKDKPRETPLFGSFNLPLGYLRSNGTADVHFSPVTPFLDSDIIVDRDTFTVYPCIDESSTKLKPFNYLNYGDYGHLSPENGSSGLESIYSPQVLALLNNVYSGPVAVQFAESLKKFTANMNPYMKSIVDEFLNSLTNNRHAAYENKQFLDIPFEDESDLTITQSEFSQLEKLKNLNIDMSFLYEGACDAKAEAASSPGEERLEPLATAPKENLVSSSFEETKSSLSNFPSNDESSQTRDSLPSISNHSSVNESNKPGSSPPLLGGTSSTEESTASNFHSEMSTSDKAPDNSTSESLVPFPDSAAAENILQGNSVEETNLDDTIELKEPPFESSSDKVPDSAYSSAATFPSVHSIQNTDHDRILSSESLENFDSDCDSISDQQLGREKSQSSEAPSSDSGIGGRTASQESASNALPEEEESMETDLVSDADSTKAETPIPYLEPSIECSTSQLSDGTPEATEASVFPAVSAQVNSISTQSQNGSSCQSLTSIDESSLTASNLDEVCVNSFQAAEEDYSNDYVASLKSDHSTKSSPVPMQSSSSSEDLIVASYSPQFSEMSAADGCKQDGPISESLFTAYESEFNINAERSSRSEENGFSMQDMEKDVSGTEQSLMSECNLDRSQNSQIPENAESCHNEDLGEASEHMHKSEELSNCLEDSNSEFMTSLQDENEGCVTVNAECSTASSQSLPATQSSSLHEAPYDAPNNPSVDITDPLQPAPSIVPQSDPSPETDKKPLSNGPLKHTPKSPECNNILSSSDSTQILDYCANIPEEPRSRPETPTQNENSLSNCTKASSKLPVVDYSPSDSEISDEETTAIATQSNHLTSQPISPTPNTNVPTEGSALPL